MSEAIHEWFGLSYCNYMVLPRTVLQSMPEEWQEAFVELVREIGDTLPNLPSTPYNIQVLAREPHLLLEEECFECHYEGINLETEEPCDVCDGEGVLECERYETPEEVGIATDPIPHYSRGRTRITADDKF